MRTIANMLVKLGNEIQFSLLTSDRDLGDTSAYPGIATDCWQPMARAQIYYVSPGIGWLWRLWKVIQGFDGSAMHLNSCFSFRFSILPLIYWRVLKLGRPVIVGPRVEFSQGALALKSPKKRVFIALTKALGLYRSVIWHASTEHEADDIRRVMGNKAQIRVAVDIACPPPVLAMQPRKHGFC